MPDTCSFAAPLCIDFRTVYIAAAFRYVDVYILSFICRRRGQWRRRLLCRIPYLFPGCPAYATRNPIIDKNMTSIRSDPSSENGSLSLLLLRLLLLSTK